MRHDSTTSPGPRPSLTRTRSRVRLWLGHLDGIRLMGHLFGLLGLAAALGAWVLYTDLARTAPVVLAAQDIPPGTRITSAMLRTVPIPVSMRPAAMQGVADTSLLVGQYSRVHLSPEQVIGTALVQTAPLDHHVYDNAPLPAEARTDHVFELPTVALASVTSQSQVNILAVVTGDAAQDPTFLVGTMDVGGQGPRVVRVLRDLNVLHVDTEAARAYLEVTAAQSQYLWSLMALPEAVQVVGELADDPQVALGPLHAGEASLTLLAMDLPDTNVLTEPTATATATATTDARTTTKGAADDPDE